MAETVLFPGKVEWSGENPAISLKQDPDGPFTAIASFFRVVLSPHGQGHALVLLRAPAEAAPPEDRANLCLTDNEPLARWLIAEFVTHMRVFQGLPSIAALGYRKLDTVRSGGNPTAGGRYSETVTAPGLAVELAWEGLGEPFCFALPPEGSSTGRHHMPTLFLGCERATITVNGATLPGAPMPREIAGQRITTAMLAFSETWVRA